MGGSGRGLRNYSTFLEGRDGRNLCAIATWNDNSALRHLRLTAFYGGLIGLLK